MHCEGWESKYSIGLYRFQCGSWLWDFASFSNGRWEVRWEWLQQGVEPLLRNSIEQYAMDKDVEKGFSKEIEEWIASGWLRPYSGCCNGIVPLMAVVQDNKDKVQPVLDFRELNQFVSSHTGESVVCSDKIRKWRKLGTNLSLLDLRKAYLQIHVHSSLWKFQVVRYKNQLYSLTRLGFGLNVAPKIMTAIVNKVLSMDDLVKAGTDSYIDDIVVNEDVVPVDRVVALLNTYGLQCKPPVALQGARVLGLRMDGRDGIIVWRRDNKVDAPLGCMTKRQLFSFCGKLVGHFLLLLGYDPRAVTSSAARVMAGGIRKLTRMCCFWSRICGGEFKPAILWVAAGQLETSVRQLCGVMQAT